jgi:hypothetical protein
MTVVGVAMTAYWTSQSSPDVRQIGIWVSERLEGVTAAAGARAKQALVSAAASVHGEGESGNINVAPVCEEPRAKPIRHQSSAEAGAKQKETRRQSRER